MSRRKKILLSLVVLVFAMFVGAYFIANHFLDSYSQQFISALAKRGKKHGVIITDPKYVATDITGLRSAKWSALFAELQFPKSEAFDPDKLFELRIGQLDAWLEGDGNVTIQVSDMQFDTIDGGTGGEEFSGIQALEESVRSKRLQFTFPMELFDPMPGLEDALSHVVALIRTGSSTMPMAAKAVLQFTLQEDQVELGMRVEQREELYVLVLEGADLHAISGMFHESLTDAEVRLIADYPLRAAQLLRIKDDAESTAEQAKQNDESVPQDAYRHVLWSYLLTRKYGAAFAERMTDAHEEGDTGNTEAEMKMDLNNNAYGRKLADRGVRRAELLSHAKNDDEVIREAKQVITP